MTSREQEAAGLLLCMMALSGGLNGGGNMAEYISYRDARNAIQANYSALWYAQMQQNSRMANCPTFNPLHMEMAQSYKRHETCKHYDRWSGWCNLMEQPAAVAGSYPLGGKCGRYEYWEPKSQMDAIDAQNVEIDEKLDRIMETLNRQKEECCCESKPRAKFETIPADVFETVEADAGTILKNEPRRSVVEIRRHMDGDPDGVFRIERKVILWDEHGNRKEIGRTPERKPLTLADLYSLAFPDDPIQAYFEGVYGRIEKEHRGRMETLERVRVKPVECPVRAVEEPDKKISVPKWVIDLAQVEVSVLIGVGVAWAIAGAIVLAINVFFGTIQSGIEFLEFVPIFVVLSFLGFSVFAIPLWGIFKILED